MRAAKSEWKHGHSLGSRHGASLTRSASSDNGDVKRVLLTGMSGVGKSSVVAELRTRGYKAIDTDEGWCDVQPDGRQRWRETAVQQLLDTEDAEILFVAGCEENQTSFYGQFDHVVLLSAPVDVLLGRVARRTNNPYGKSAVELCRIRADVEGVEPLLRRGADHEIVTDVPLAEVVVAVLHAVEQ